MTPDSYRIPPGDQPHLAKRVTDDDGGLTKTEARERFLRLRRQLIRLQELMYAEGKHALLVVLQAMDTAGKDSTIRQVFRGVNLQGCVVTPFKRPSEEELAHDFLWRIHQHVPRRGCIGVFNRSHYEDVLIVRVKDLVPAERWMKRYDHINAFEELLHDEGTRVVKFHLHISKQYQKERLQRRLDDPRKRWKFDPADLAERARWDQYVEAYEEAIARCSTRHAPWYVVPAETRCFRNLLIAQVLVDTLKGLDMKYPKPAFDPKSIVIE